MIPDDKLIPMPDRVLVRPDDDPRTLGRLILPDAARRFAKKGLTGTVVAVGEDCNLSTLRPGDRIIYHWAGYKLDGTDNVVALKEESILARLSDTTTTLTTLDEADLGERFVSCVEMQ